MHGLKICDSVMLVTVLFLLHSNSSESPQMLKLKPYQDESVTACVDNVDKPVLIELPTGSGKSLVGVTAACLLAKAGRTVIIATTQQSIERAFAGYGKVSTSHGVVDCSVVQAARAGSGSAASLVVGSIAANEPVVIATTHSVLTRIEPELLPDSLQGVSVFIDEAHHAALELTKLGQFVHEVHRRGGQLVYLTATAYRSDCGEIIVDGTEVFIRTLSQHMAEGCCPRFVDVDWLPYRVDKIDEDLFYGDSVSSEPSVDQVANLASRMVATWVKTGKPKVIVRVPSMPSGALITVSRLCEAYSKAGARVLNASGICTVNGVEINLSDELETERNRKYPDSQYDVIVGCNRVIEGMDWPHCSDVYCVGVPRSVRTVEQLMGRAMRKRFKDCPKEFREISSIRFFLPCQSERGFDGLNKKQAFHVLLICAMIEDSTNAALWSSLEGRTRRLTTVPASEDRPRRPMDDSMKDWVRTTAYYHLAVEAIVSSGAEPTVDSVREWMLAPEHELDSEMVDKLISQRSDGQKFSGASINGLPDGFEIDGAVALATEFDRDARVSNSFRSLVLRLSPSLISDYGNRMKVLVGPVLPQMDAFQKLSRRLRRGHASGRVVANS